SPALTLSPSRTRTSRMRPAILAATAESSPSTRPVSSTTLDGVDGPAKNSRQATSPTIARAATAINGATFLLDVGWLESDASAARSFAIVVSQVSANYPFDQCQPDLLILTTGPRAHRRPRAAPPR